jgi:hypothetical protein
MPVAVIQLLTLVVLAIALVALTNYATRKWALIFSGKVRYPLSDENVQFTVYKPSVVESDRWYKLVAFAHLSQLPADAGPGTREPLVEVRERVRLAFPQTGGEYQLRTVDARRSVPREGVITFKPEFKGLKFVPARHDFLWQGQVHQAEFDFSAPHELEGKTVYGQMNVYAGSVIIAAVDLSIHVNSQQAKTAAPAAPESTTASQYRKIFVSYSRKDSSVVDRVVMYVRSTGDEFLRDVTHLRAGEVWEPRLEELIKEADVFQLFWSSNSMRSEFVRREWEYALSLNRRNFIRPIYWEMPLPEDKKAGLPPQSLSKIDFFHLSLNEGPLSRAVKSVRTGATTAAAILMATVVMNVMVWRGGRFAIDPSLLTDVTPTPMPSPKFIPTPGEIGSPTPETTPSSTPAPTPRPSPRPTASPIIHPTPRPDNSNTSSNDAQKRKYAKAADDIAGAISAMIDAKRSLAKQGRITLEEERRLTQLLSTVNDAEFALVMKLKTTTIVDAGNKAELLSLLSRLTSAVNDLNNIGVLKLGDADAKQRLAKFISTINVALAILSQDLAALHQAASFPSGSRSICSLCTL